MSGQKAAILLLAHGSPDSPADMPEFMKHITGGRPVPDSVIQEVAHRYSLIGKSPLTEITLEQAEGLKNKLGPSGLRWHAQLEAIYRRCGAADDGRWCRTGRCHLPGAAEFIDQRGALSQGAHGGAESRELGCSLWNRGTIIRCWSRLLRNGWSRSGGRPETKLERQLPVIFTAHSVPMRTIHAGDPYEKQAKETAQLVGAKDCGTHAGVAALCFSKPGNVRRAVAWTDRGKCHARTETPGHPGVVIAPIGFVCDHVEVLYDIDIGFRQFANEQGLKLWRPESLNTSPTFIAALAKLASTRAGAGFRHCLPGMKRIAIIGGGIAGLSAAFYLEKARRAARGLQWALFEKSDRLGGVIQTDRRDGFVVEAGPDSFLTIKPDAARLCHELGHRRSADSLE